jgi:LmbE family N-acetylglucosaminyl deacetylase
MTGSQKRILALHAHPDDVEIQCAGTLALLKQRGHHIDYMTMTPGDCGSAELGPLAIAATRRVEARAAADLLGVDYECLEFRDLAICFDNPSRQRVTEALRRVQPDIVLTAPPVDYMPDHEITSRLVRDACFNAAVPNYDTRQPIPAACLEKIPHLYYVDPVEGTDWYGNAVEPSFIVDTSSVFDLKRDMLACHASQREWLRRQHGMDEYLDSMERWSRQRGSQISAEHGEGYRQHLGHPHPQDNLLLSLLG